MGLMRTAGGWVAGVAGMAGVAGCMRVGASLLVHCEGHEFPVCVRHGHRMRDYVVA